MKLRGSSENPASHTLKQCNPRKFDGARASKPFPLRMNSAIQDEPLRNQKIKEIQCSKVPPWKSPEPSVCPKTIAKKSASNEELRARFMDHGQVHSGSIKHFTDVVFQ